MRFLSLFVASGCNRDCRACSQRPLRKFLPGYFMRIDEVARAASLANRRFTHWSLSGGEPLLWPALEDACELLHNARVGHLRVFSNGRAAHLVTDRLVGFVDMLRISRYGDNDEQIKALQSRYGRKVELVDTPQHFVFPSRPLPDSLPGRCFCQKTMVTGDKIYPCPNFLSVSLRLGEKWHEDPDLVKPLAGNFWPSIKFQYGHHAACAACGANKRLHNRLVQVKTATE